MDVIFHIDETIKWPTVLSNLKHMNAWYIETGTTGTIELLINGEAVEQAIKASDVNFQEEIDHHIKIAVCQNSLDKRQIATADLQDAVAVVVPSGVVELALKQQQGYSYIKP
ncbi:DsrE family protein [Weissella soli]|jgi:intracellular sulfur oxidation DsrE/DsrF family protein|uniref:DsrE family protein n=1 Tax=Weissella soli TaxID=155866 RepID=UPI003C739963